MNAIDTLKQHLTERTGATFPDTKTGKPENIAFVDVNACNACGLCISPCPVSCIEPLAEGKLEGRAPAPVQVRYQECTGCGLCMEICSIVAERDAIRMFETNLVEQALAIDILEAAPDAPEPPEPMDDTWAEEGSFHHMGTESVLRDTLSDEEKAAIRAAPSP